MGKYSKFLDPDHQVKTFRWPYWLLPLLFLSLILVLGLFIFITIHSADRFGCLFHCEQKIDDGGVYAPKDDAVAVASKRRDKNITESVTKRNLSKEVVVDKTKTEESQNSTESHVKKTPKMMTVKGELIFPSNRVPDSIPPNSYLEVNFEDSSLQDAAAENLGKTVVNVTSYKKGSPLTYKIECPKPENHHSDYSVSATLNMGWTPTKGGEWLKNGDFFTDTMFPVNIKKNVSVYERDITFAYYSS